jgi:hypothetical protein
MPEHKDKELIGSAAVDIYVYKMRTDHACARVGPFGFAAATASRTSIISRWSQGIYTSLDIMTTYAFSPSGRELRLLREWRDAAGVTRKV